MVVSISYNLLWLAAATSGIYKPNVPARTMRRIRNAYLFALPIYLAAAFIAWHNAYAGLGLCLSLWILWATLSYEK